MVGRWVRGHQPFFVFLYYRHAAKFHNVHGKRHTNVISSCGVDCVHMDKHIHLCIIPQMLAMIMICIL